MKTACRSKPRTQLGFTLIELVVTVSIVAILATVAVPNFRTFILNNRIKSTTQSLLSSIQTARSEALKRQTNVELCFTSNTSTCITSNNQNIGGWKVYEGTDPTNSTKLIQSQTIDSTKTYLLVDSNKLLSYAKSGFPASANDLDYVVICDSRKNRDSNGGSSSSAQSVARGLFIPPTGRAQTITTVGGINNSLISALLQSVNSRCL